MPSLLFPQGSNLLYLATFSLEPEREMSELLQLGVQREHHSSSDLNIAMTDVSYCEARIEVNRTVSAPQSLPQLNSAPLAAQNKHLGLGKSQGADKELVVVEVLVHSGLGCV